MWWQHKIKRLAYDVGDRRKLDSLSLGLAVEEIGETLPGTLWTFLITQDDASGDQPSALQHSWILASE